jgi:hypothetical protein
MSELKGRFEMEPTAEVIASELEGWLKREVDNSVTGRNKYLDDFSDFRNSLVLPYGDRSNTNAAKNRSHYDRTVNWTNGLLDFYEDFNPDQKDYAISRQIFCAQMSLSGLFRIQCLMQAADQDDYYRRRTGGSGVGIDLEKTVADRLKQLQSVEHAMSLDDIAARTLEINDQQQAYVEELHETGQRYAGQDSSPAIDSGLVSQNRWAGLIVDYIVFASHRDDGDLASVPFLEPKSISDNPEVYYPFANPPYQG